MPLIDAVTPPTDDEGLHYVVYFASGSPPWCPDCVDALAPLRAVFGATEGAAPKAYVVRVGERHEWKGVKDNKYRLEPYNVEGVPTIVKMQGTKELGRLGEEGCKDEAALRKLVAG
ncbi:hypothetical protein FA10DRAFT_265180 [Acaromyces ingoldii]|uniref:Thioredoxin domain-containing protein n=1 Tax=Acaromyces ingoldii TaxID=215250 RepID=A0A316YQM2_9BASI|nr:hypothetical protein FA10DRAFT_265180 [Acaromyces ingoldii]PWN91316.1 hypothetical protein FA10DRAFT_265180 [Acaromyces ingoldii]